jgi:hypothetical protein
MTEKTTGTSSNAIERRVMPNPTPKTTKNIGIRPDMKIQMTFLQAMAAVNHGDTVTRESWDDPNLHVKMHKGQMCVKLQDGVYHPMIVSQEDFDGEDWITVQVPGVPKIPGTTARASAPIVYDPTLGKNDQPEPAVNPDPRDQPGKDE